MATLGGILGTIGEGAKTLANNPNFNAAVVYSRTGDPAQAARVKLMIQEDARRAEEEKRMQEYYAQQRQLAEMQAMQAYQDMQRQQYSQALLGAASTQPQGLLTDPNFQRSLRQRAAAYGDPKVLEAGGLLAPLPEASKETTLIANLRAAGIDPSSPRGQAIILQSVMKPQTQINMGPDLGQGMMWNKPGDPSSGVSYAPGYLEMLAAAERAKADARVNAENAPNATATVDNVDAALSLLDSIKKDPAIPNAYGVIAGRAPTIRQSTQDFETRRNQLVYMLGLAARGQMKGTGQISNFEQEMLLKAQTTLADPRISPEAARAEMDNMEKWLRAKRDAASQSVIVPRSSSAQSGGFRIVP